VNDAALQAMFDAVSVALLWLFISTVLLGFVAWVRSFRW
jgi:hypothetical protein